MIKVIRIDHRLLHGQVIFAWTKSQGIERIVELITLRLVMISRKCH